MTYDKKIFHKASILCFMIFSLSMVAQEKSVTGSVIGEGGIDTPDAGKD